MPPHYPKQQDEAGEQLDTSAGGEVGGSFDGRDDPSAVGGDHGELVTFIGEPHVPPSPWNPTSRVSL